MVRVWTVLLLVAGCWAVLPHAPAAACSCAPMSARQARDAADVVFRGTVIAEDDPDGGDAVVSSAREVH
jgi:hypothetical protein